MAFELVTGPLNRRPKSVGDWEESPDERKFFLDWLRSDEAAQNALVSVTMTVSCYEQAKSRADFDVANIQDGWLLDGGTDDPVEVEVPVRRCEKGWQVGYRAGFSARQPLISDEQFDSDLAVLYGDDGMRICWIEGVKAEINEDHEQWESKMYKRLNQPFEDNLIDLTQDAPDPAREGGNQSALAPFQTDRGKNNFVSVHFGKRMFGAVALNLIRTPSQSIPSGP
jgi:hypothetical protein